MSAPSCSPPGEHQAVQTLVGKHRYQVVSKLNSGTFGFVRLAVDVTNGKQCAIKFLDRGEKVSKYVEREILNHRRLVHPHIVRFKEVLLTDAHICIVMEYADKGSLRENMEGLTMEQNVSCICCCCWCCCCWCCCCC